MVDVGEVLENDVGEIEGADFEVCAVVDAEVFGNVADVIATVVVIAFETGSVTETDELASVAIVGADGHVDADVGYADEDVGMPGHVIAIEVVVVDVGYYAD